MSIHYLLRRIFYMVPTLLGISLVCFIIFHVVGGDPAYQLAGKNASVKQIESIRSELGTNKSLPLQYVDFLKQIVTFNWGYSWQTRGSISTMIYQGVGPSVCLLLPILFFSFLVSLGLALVTTHFKDSWQDRTLTTLCLALMSVSLLVYIIVFQYFFAFRLSLFPVNGWDPSIIGRWQYLILPWIIGVFVTSGPNILLYRSALIDESDQNYVTTAKAKGLSQSSLYLQHILKNAMIPIATLLMIQLPTIFTGSLLLEAFFGIPGLGGTLIGAIQNSDFPVIKAITVVSSLIYMGFNLVTDIIYSFLDPRVNFK